MLKLHYEYLFAYPLLPSTLSFYSGGNKRRLSIAIAMMGNPLLILMDEPSSGADPIARKLISNVVRKACESDKAIMLSSHRCVSLGGWIQSWHHCCDYRRELLRTKEVKTFSVWWFAYSSIYHLQNFHFPFEIIKILVFKLYNFYQSRFIQSCSLVLLVWKTVKPSVPS